ncbi:MAG: hypothetical protein ACOYBY_13530 [Dermatophilaceae bacterium]
MCQLVRFVRSIRPETIDRLADVVDMVGIGLRGLADSRRGAAAEPTVPDGRAEPTMPDGRAQPTMPDGRAQPTMPDGRAQPTMPDGRAEPPP